MESNDEARPAVGRRRVEEVIDLLLAAGSTFETTLEFKGWVRKIDTLSPEALNAFRLLHHLERYWFAADYLGRSTRHPLRILDVGTGAGYGLQQFIQRFPSSLQRALAGIEIDGEALKEARRQLPKLNVFLGNALDVDPGGPFDTLFCFELLGNKSLDSDESLLSRLDSLCAAGGHIFLSIAAFGNTEAGRARAKDYSARIYDSTSFAALVTRLLAGYRHSFFGQVYPLKRMFENQCGVWPNPRLDQNTDFLICVAQKKGDRPR